MIVFTYSQQKELDEILWIYSEYDFYIKNKYRVFYPEISKSLKKALIASQDDPVTIKQLKKEFDKIFEQKISVYKKALTIVVSSWTKIENRFFAELSKLNLPTMPKDFTCFISQYGPGGSYYPPNKISIRIAEKYNKDIAAANETIAHEITHLAIDKLAEKYKLGFENTERLVDLILTKTPIAKLLDNPMLQGFGDKRLDELFDLYSNDISTLLKRFEV